VNALTTAEAKDWTTKLKTFSAVQDIVSRTDLSDNQKTETVKKFCSHPPPFVNEEFGISLENYVNFIQKIVKETKKSTENTTAAAHIGICEKIAECFQEVKTDVEKMKTHFDTDVLWEGKTMK